MSKKNEINDLARMLGNQLMTHQLHCAVAESCTGGSLAAAITEIPGSSQWFDCGFVTYSNGSKEALLGVPVDVLSVYGAVSQETACAMAEGVLAKSSATIAASITGIAGPDGGSLHKPVGTVWVAWASRFHPTSASLYLFEGDRRAIREQSVIEALRGLIKLSR